MRKFSQNIDTLIATGNPSVFHTVSIVLTDVLHDLGYTDINDTTAPVDIGVFKATNGLFAVEPPRLSQAVDRETYKITYADPNFEKISLFDRGLSNSIATVRIGFYNTTDAPLGGAEPGAPLTNLEDFIIAYQGFVDTQGYSISPEDGTVIAVIECSSPVASLGMVRALYTSKESLSNYAVGDTAFDQIHSGSKKVMDVWGKASKK